METWFNFCQAGLTEKPTYVSTFRRGGLCTRLGANDPQGVNIPVSVRARGRELFMHPTTAAMTGVRRGRLDFDHAPSLSTA